MLGLILVLTVPGLSRSVQAATIDLLLVYDTTAASWVEDNGGPAAFSLQATEMMNQALDNSGVDLTFRLVHYMYVDYKTSDLLDDLEALQQGEEGLAAAHSARDKYGADLVAMLVDTGSASWYVGISYLLTCRSGQPEYAFSVNAVRSVDIRHTLTHEVGHNLGAHHSRYQASDPGPNDYLDNQYSAGWYFTGSNNIAYHTIMAYNDDGYGNLYVEAPLFSTPLVKWQGEPAGDAYEGDNARLIRETRETVSGYRDPVYNIKAEAAPETGGTVTGGGLYTYGHEATLTAEAEDGYVFVHWIEDGRVVSCGSEYTFTVASQRILKAVFSPGQDQYVITGSVSPEGWGEVSGAGFYAHGSDVDLKASPQEKFAFASWTETWEGLEGSCIVSRNEQISFPAERERSLTARMRPKTLPGVMLLLMDDE